MRKITVHGVTYKVRATRSGARVYAGKVELDPRGAEAMQVMIHAMANARQGR